MEQILLRVGNKIGKGERMEVEHGVKDRVGSVK